MAIQAQLYSDNVVGFPLCGSQDWIDNGCGGFNQFCFGLQQKQPLHLQPQQQQQLQQLQNQNQQQQRINHQTTLCFDNSVNLASSFKNINSTPTASSNTNRESAMYGQTMASQADQKQTHEIDQFIRSQNERLRLFLHEQRKQQVAVLVKKVESKASVLIRQKDEEIAKAANKSMELQSLLRKLEMESQAWQRVAQENEAMVMTLNSRLEQLREQASCCFNNGVDDAESCCEVNREQGIETEENRAVFVVDEEEEVEEEERRRKMAKTTTMVCKCCNSRSSCVLFLPCRHLCSCKECAAFVDSCPVCRTAKKASIEALIS